MDSERIILNQGRRLRPDFPIVEYVRQSTLPQQLWLWFTAFFRAEPV